MAPVRCTDADAGYSQHALAEIERLRAERRWIPVTESLPDAGESVLVAWNYKDGKEQAVSQAWHDPMRNFLSIEDSEFPGVTHWMPLPEPPTSGEVGR